MFVCDLNGYPTDTDQERLSSGGQMGGQDRVESSDGTHTVTIGSADDQKTSGATAFVSQQDNQGNKTTTVYDANHSVVKETTKGPGN